MVLRHTSSHFSTFFRTAAAAVRLATSASSAARNPVRRLAAKLSRAVHVTQHTLSGSPLHAHVPLGPGHLPKQRYLHTAPTNPLGPVNGAFRRGGYRPSARAPRGAAVPANVGLGSARTFASAPAAGSIASQAGNVPIVLRAFAHLFDEEYETSSPALPRARRYVPYTPRRERTRSLLRQNRRERRCSAKSEMSERSLVAELAHFFPVVPSADIPLPPTPETLVTSGKTTTLSLPLAPSFESILAPTPRVHYADAEIGVAILASLTEGMDPMHDAYSFAAGRVIPLLARLENLGILEPRVTPNTSLEVSEEGDILRIVFQDRSVADVRALLDDHLEGDWYVLAERKARQLSPAEEAQMQEHWEARPRTVTLQTERADTAASTVSLVMPVLDASTPTLYTHQHAWLDSYASYPATETESSMVSGASTPSCLDSWATSDGSEIGSGLGSMGSFESRDFRAHRALSLLGLVAMREDEWSVPPSEADADVESVDSDDEVVVSWMGHGLGLAQPW